MRPDAGSRARGAAVRRAHSATAELRAARTGPRLQRAGEVALLGPGDELVRRVRALLLALRVLVHPLLGLRACCAQPCRLTACGARDAERARTGRPQGPHRPRRQSRGRGARGGARAAPPARRAAHRGARRGSRRLLRAASLACLPAAPWTHSEPAQGSRWARTARVVKAAAAALAAGRGRRRRRGARLFAGPVAGVVAVAVARRARRLRPAPQPTEGPAWHRDLAIRVRTGMFETAHAAPAAAPCVTPSTACLPGCLHSPGARVKPLTGASSTVRSSWPSLHGAEQCMRVNARTLVSRRDHSWAA